MKQLSYDEKKSLGIEHNTGVVYLLRCKASGIFKLGATSNPVSRIRFLIREGEKRGLSLAPVWWIVTNGLNLIEPQWRDRWRQFQLPGSYDWFKAIPEREIHTFRAATAVECYGERLPDYLHSVYGTELFRNRPLYQNQAYEFEAMLLGRILGRN